MTPHDTFHVIFQKRVDKILKEARLMNPIPLPIVCHKKKYGYQSHPR